MIFLTVKIILIFFDTSQIHVFKDREFRGRIKAHLEALNNCNVFLKKTMFEVEKFEK